MTQEEIRASQSELLEQCFAVVVGGDYVLEAWEFPTHIGAERAEARSVVDRWLGGETLGKEMFIIHNCLLELGNAQSLSDRRWAKAFRSSRDDVEGLYKAWFNSSERHEASEGFVSSTL